ncbi:putative Tyrosine--tRNA ligase, cytoplasmic [Nannochloris sp. 'desiccata']|nr:putative Tyrosine--tRNA ligase, cytoplasmic [Chlorella desiccata (nom. nud.)]
MGSALQDALKKVELLIDQLQSGNFVGIGAALPVPDKLLPAPKSQAKAAKSAAVPKEKPAKAKASGAGGGGGAAIEGPELLAKAHLAVARVTSVVEHPNSDKLYITTLDVGNDQTRQVVAGLRKYIAAEDLQGSLVAAVLNLKAAKLGGELSEGMILASSEPEGVGEGRVKPLVPHASSAPGDQLRLQGHDAPDPDGYPKTLKGDHWRKIVPSLAVIGGVACFDGKPLATSSGLVGAPSFPDKSTIS